MIKQPLTSLTSIVIFALISINCLYAQADLPKIIKPSPETSALFKFQDYPMDYSTGLPQINIPLYEVQSGSLSVPISISYHASGRRVTDVNGPISVGWSLNAGGSVARTINGSVDFGTNVIGTYKFPYPFKVDALSVTNDQEYLQKVIHYENGECGIQRTNWYDSEYDIFSYSFGGINGKFLFKDINSVKTPVWLPYKPFNIKIAYTSYGLGNIEIADDKGNLYQFEPNETYSQSQYYATSAWGLKKIISADRTDTISFNYVTFYAERKTVSQQGYLMDDWNMYGEDFPYPNGVSYTENYHVEAYSISRLTEIVFKQGKVKFNLVNGSSDIDNIQIFNSANQLIKSIQFQRSECYSVVEAGILATKLDAVNFKNSTGGAVETFSFNYYPFANASGNINLRHRDWWGYYNNSGKIDIMPYWTNVPYIEGNLHVAQNIEIGNYYGDREPNLAALQSGVLNKITYPTGGTTEFIYEQNKCKLNGNSSEVRTGPGLRLYKLITTDGRGINTTRTFKYGANESGHGSIDLLPSYQNMASEIITGYVGSPNVGRSGSYRERFFYSDFIPELAELAERPVIYTDVTEYLGTENFNTGKIKYTYDYSSWYPSSLWSFIQLSISKKHIPLYNYWDNPSLLLKEEYKSTGTVYQKVKETQFTYSSTTIEQITGLHVQRLLSLPQPGYFGAILPGSTSYVGVCAEKYVLYNNNQPFTVFPAPVYTYRPYSIPAGYKNLIETTETSYTSNGVSIVQTTNNQYNAKQLVSKTTKNLSDGAPIVTEIKYPFDYTGNTILTQMTGLNMLNYPVEQISTKNTTIPISSVRTNYLNFGTTPARIYPQTIDVKKGSNAYETRLRYLSYDNNGNPLSVSKELDTKIAYIWDYNKEFPIAEVINAASSEIAYTSFEADGSGNWTGLNNANIVSNTTGITGTKYYTLNAIGLNVSGLSTAKKYTVTYWSRNGAYTVSGTSDAGYPKNVRTVTLNGVSWTLWEHKVGSIATVTVSGSGAIDELRLYPADAQMTTYTFIPLVGMSTKNEPNNRIAYYEYDAFGRLKLVKDMNGNVLKTMDYKYKSPTP